MSLSDVIILNIKFFRLRLVFGKVVDNNINKSEMNEKK